MFVVKNLHKKSGKKGDSFNLGVWDFSGLAKPEAYHEAKLKLSKVSKSKKKNFDHFFILNPLKKQSPNQKTSTKHPKTSKLSQSKETKKKTSKNITSKDIQKNPYFHFSAKTKKQKIPFPHDPNLYTQK